MRCHPLLVLMLGFVTAVSLPVEAQPPDATPLLPAEPWQNTTLHAPEAAATWELQEGELPVARVTVTEAPENDWEIGFGWDTVAPIAKDDTLVLSFEARAEGGGDPPGSINLAFRRVTKPYHHALSETVNLASEWREFQLPFSPTVEMEAGGGTLRLNLGTQQQTVEIRNLSLVNYGSEISHLALCRMLGIDPGAAGNRPVGRHLTPDLLWEMRVFDEFPAPDPDFDPAGVWEQTWRIWTCYGYIGRANRNLGVLRIWRAPGDPFILTAERTQLSEEGLKHVQTAEVTCALDALGSPQRWVWSSRFFRPTGGELDELAIQRSVDSPPDGDVTADWCLFEAVQRLPFDASAEHSFDMLEGLSVLKRGHTLRYDGAHDLRFGTQTRTLHRFVQTGHGALPYEWWLDENHRVVLAVTGYRVYVLDPNAYEAMNAEFESQLSRYERMKERYAPETEDDDGE